MNRRGLVGQLVPDSNYDDDSDIVAEIVHTINVLFVLVGACLVFFMQIGFSMLEVGSVHASSTKNVLLKNIIDASISAVTWSLLGHGLAFGPSLDPSGFLPGNSGFVIYAGRATATENAHWLFQWAFVSTAATIVSGAVAQRIRLEAYLTFAVLLSVLTYPLIVHWVWSDDGMFSAGRGQDSSGAVPLFGCGVLDFAGSGVVHVTGGLSALIAIVMLGPRDGVTFNAQGYKRAPVGQSPTLRTLGTLSLWFGWFGFNGCSVSFLVGQTTVAARAMVMTAISGGVSGLAGTLVAYLQADGRRQIDLSTTLNSILAGLVGITANCATVRLEGAFFIGIMSAVVYVFSVRLLNRYHIDDVVEAVPVHLACGLWGVIAAGFFTVPSLYVEAYPRAPGDESDDGLGTRAKACAGVLYGGNGSQLGANLTFLLLQGPWIVVTVGVLFTGLQWYGVLRVSKLVEKVGLDEMFHNDRGTREDEDREMEMTQGFRVSNSRPPSFVLDESSSLSGGAVAVGSDEPPGAQVIPQPPAVEFNDEQPRRPSWLGATLQPIIRTTSNSGSFNTFSETIPTTQTNRSTNTPTSFGRVAPGMSETKEAEEMVLPALDLLVKQAEKSRAESHMSTIGTERGAFDVSGTNRDEGPIMESAATL